MITFKEGRWFIGIWFVAYVNSDVLFTAYTDEQHETTCTWEMNYRFRYYDPEDPHNDPFSGKDRKSEWSAQLFNATEETAKKSVDMIIDTMSLLEPYQHKVFCPLYSSDPQECMDILSKQPWAHMKQVSEEEYEEYKEKGRHE